MNKTFYLILILGLISCGNKNESSSDAKSVTIRENPDKNDLEIDLKILSQIEQEIDKKCEPLKREVWKYGKDGGEEHYFLDTGVVFRFIAENKAHLIFEKFHKKVVSGGNYLFLSNMDFDKSYNTYFDIVIINCSDPFKVIELVGTDGVNYDLYNDDIINKLKEWDKVVGFEFEVIDVSRIQAYISKLPKDVPKFTADIYEFCPDVINQGYGSMEEMISDYKQNRYFWLWWD